MSNWYNIFKTSSESKKKEYSWVCINIPDKIGKKTIKFAKSIPERELFVDKNIPEWQYGIAEDPHITLLWGLHTRDNRKVKNVLKGQKGGVITLGKTAMFKNEDYDVLKVNINSHALHRLNKKIKNNLDHTTSHPVYHPHITLAYLKCGNGEKYIKDDRFEGLQFNFEEVIFEDYNENVTIIELESTTN